MDWEYASEMSNDDIGHLLESALKDSSDVRDNYSYDNPVPAEQKDKKLLIIGNANEFLVKRVITEAESRGFEVSVCQPYPSIVDELGKGIKVYLLFVDSAERLKELLTHLKDTAYDKRSEIGLVGEKLDLQEAVKYIGKENANMLFERPVDARQICNGLDELSHMAESRGRRKRILIVDDDPVTLVRVQKILHNHYKVYTARSACPAFMTIARHKIDLILLDYTMPVIDGPRFLQALRLEPETEGIPVIFMSGHTDARSITTAMTLGSEHYIAKSSGAQELITIISDFFSKQDWQANNR